MIDPALIPKSPAHQRFADLYLAGNSLVDSYLGAGYKCKRASAMHAGKRLLKAKDVQEYIRAVQSKAADSSVLSLLERRRFYARIVRTPLLAIDPDHPEQRDGDLIRKCRRHTTEFGETLDFEKLDPLKACELDTKAAGEDPEANGLSDLAAAIAALAPSSTLPAGKL